LNAFFKYPIVNGKFPFGNGLLSFRNDEKLTGKDILLNKKKEKEAI
jgi:hypothetical protein